MGVALVFAIAENATCLHPLQQVAVSIQWPIQNVILRRQRARRVWDISGIKKTTDFVLHFHNYTWVLTV